jgi:uncharacterized protein YihD (DUF1040 family)
MRDSKRIDRILGMISSLWHQAPDLRLGQLLTNYANFNDDNYSTEDDITEEKLKYWYNKKLKEHQSETEVDKCYNCDIDNPSCSHCIGC